MGQSGVVERTGSRSDLASGQKQVGPVEVSYIGVTTVDGQGKVSLRHDSKLHHIGLGRAHKGKPIKLLVADRDIRVLDADTGELIRRLTLDPTRDYQPIDGA